MEPELENFPLFLAIFSKKKYVSLLMLKLTPMDRLQLATCHSRGQHIRVSIQPSVLPPVVPLYQTDEPGPV